MRLFTFIAVLFFGFVATAQTADDFVFEIDVPANTVFSFSITATGTIDLDWGDGQTSQYLDPNDLSISNNYVSAGTYWEIWILLRLVGTSLLI